MCSVEYNLYISQALKVSVLLIASVETLSYLENHMTCSQLDVFLCLKWFSDGQDWIFGGDHTTANKIKY